MRRTELPEQVWAALAAAGIGRGETLVVAVSGGLDSVGLLDLLRTGAPAGGLHLHVAHMDHRLRPESGEDAAFVAGLAAEWGIPATVEAADVMGWAARHGLGVEAAAREVRYRFLAQVVAAQAASGAVTAHTADDQVETILLHLLRGAGAAGWTGMVAAGELRVPGRGEAPAAAVRVLRPLLGSRRGEVAAWVAARGLAWVEDASNRDVRFTRNRLRHEVLPRLDAINPRWREALLRSAELTRDEHAVVVAAADAAWPAIAVPADVTSPDGSAGGRAGVQLDVAGLAAQPRAVQRLLLRRAVALALADDAPRLEPTPTQVELPMERVEAALGLVEGRTGARVELGGGLVAEREYDQLVIHRLIGEEWSARACLGADPRAAGAGEAGAAGDDGLLVLVPGETADPDGRWRLRTQLLAPEAWQLARAAAGPPGTELRVGLDAQAVGGLAVRRWRPGDRLQPLGMRGIKKVHDLLVDAKVPRRERARLHLLTSPRGIAWVVGVRIAEWAKVTPATVQVLWLEWAWRTEGEANDG